MQRISRLLSENTFEFILISNNYMFRKPNRRIFELALEKAVEKAIASSTAFFTLYKRYSISVYRLILFFVQKQLLLMIIYITSEEWQSHCRFHRF